MKEMKEIDEASYILGSQRAWTEVISECRRNLPESFTPEGKTWEIERNETVLRLRSLCIQLDIDTDWSDDLYLPDILEQIEDVLLS